MNFKLPSFKTSFLLQPQIILVIALAWVISLGVVGYKAYGHGKDTAFGEVATQQVMIANTVNQVSANLRLDFQGILTTYLNDKTIKEITYQDRIVKVPQYVTVKADSECALTNGFVESHDAAVDNRPLSGDLKNVDEHVAIKLSEATLIIDKNYSSCSQNSDQLIALQQEIRQYQARLAEFEAGDKRGVFGGLFK